MDARTENSTIPSNRSFAWAATEIINGPNGKEVIWAITIVSVSVVLLSAFGMQRGYVPYIGYRDISFALLKA
jgi:hypothetical protein